MRIPLLVMASALSLSLASPAQGMPDGVTPASNRAKLTCLGGVVGVDGTNRVNMLHLKNGKVTDSERSGTALSFQPTAWGFYDSRDTKAGSVLRMNAVASDGRPQRVTMSFKDGSNKIAVSSSRYDQDGFKPQLFADGYPFYAYTVNGSGKLQRWVLTRFRNGDIRFAGKVTVGSGYGDLTSLQASQVFQRKGAREYLYATTESGALEQIAVPLKKPKKEKRRMLLATGYAGVTELAWAYCNGDPTYASLVAIDPTAEVASWTTVRNSVKNPQPKLRGNVTGGDHWDLVAAY